MIRIRRNIGMSLAVLLSAFILYACSEDKSYDIKFSNGSDIAWPEGSMLSYLDGSVNLDFQPGTVDDPVKIKVNECHNGQNCDFVMKVIYIEPEMSFNGPVNVSIKCDGNLANGDPITDGCTMVVYGWENQEEFYSNSEGTILYCSKDEATGMVSFCIKQTGVYAVGIMEQGFQK